MSSSSPNNWTVHHQIPNIVSWSMGILFILSLFTSPHSWGASGMVAIRTQTWEVHIYETFTVVKLKLSDICFLEWTHTNLLYPTPLNKALELTHCTLLTAATINQYYQLAGNHNIYKPLNIPYFLYIKIVCLNVDPSFMCNWFWLQFRLTQSL